MRISKIEINNFRGFSTESIHFGDITVLIGENNVGKSTILDAVRLALVGVDRSDAVSKYDFHLADAKAQLGDAGDIGIRLELSEPEADAWPDEIQQALSDCIDIDQGGLRHFYLSVKGHYDRSQEKPVMTREFQNGQGISKGSKANTSRNFAELKKLVPVFYISSLRDAARQFEQKSGLFSSFLRNTPIEEGLRKQIESQLSTVNQELLEALSGIHKVKEHLKKTSEILTGNKEAGVDIEPLPSDLQELISRSAIILHTKTGVRLPLLRHGSGSQSLSVLFLYEAFLTVLLASEYDKYSEPLLLIEEPEAHLHPSAVRLFWHFLKSMPGQKIITTHSGDILANVPIENIRRIAGTTGANRILSIDGSKFDVKDKRYLRRYIAYSRGELYFARIWLLVEGETEQTFFNGVLNHDGTLDRLGVRIIEYAQNDLETFLILADQIGIKWLLVSDGDSEGEKYSKKARKHVRGSNPDEKIIKLDEATLEVHLMMHGFSADYEAHLSPQTSPNVTGVQGTVAYYESLYKAIKDGQRKPQIAMDVVAKILDNATEPPIIGVIRTKLEAMS